MTEELYRRSLSWFSADPRRAKAAAAGMVVLEWLFAISYSLLLAVLAYRREYTLLWRSVLVPAAGFMVLSVFRRILDRPRPCEVYDIEPLQERDVPGRSFPSRHTFCAVLIAMAVLRANPWAGAVLLVFAAGLGALRVASGLHFIRDVIAGAAAAAAIGLFGLFRL